MTITLRQLEIFEKVAVSGHVTKASEQLYLSQSAVSMAIADMERITGAPLFERRGRRLILNDRGREILPEVQEVLRRVFRIEQFLNESVEEPVGVLKVGASTTIGNYLLPKIVGEFSARHPRAKVLLYVANTQQIEDAVERGEYDLGLTEGPSHNPSLKAQPWIDDELVVISGKNHSFADTGNVSADMLAGADWIIREKGSGTREIFEAAMAAHGIEYNVSMELGHTEAIKKAVEAGMGVGCLSRMAVQRELNNWWLMEIGTPLDLRRTLYIVTRENSYQTRLFRAYMSLLESIRA